MTYGKLIVSQCEQKNTKDNGAEKLECMVGF